MKQFYTHINNIFSLLFLTIVLLIGCEQKTMGPGEGVADAGWRQALQLDITRRLMAVWSDAPGEVYTGYSKYEMHLYNFLDTHPAVYRFDGSSWIDLNYPADWSWHNMEIWGTGPDNIYVADYNLYRYDGTSWTQQPILATVVTGTDENHVYAANNEQLFYFNGTTWNVLRDFENQHYAPTAIWAESGPSVFVAKRHDICQLHENMWFETELPIGVTDLWGTGPDDVYAIGESYSYYQPRGIRIWHFNGSDWSELFAGDEDMDVTAAWGSGTGDFYLTDRGGKIHIFDGSTLRLEPVVTSSTLYDIYGTGPDDIYAVGDDQKVLHYDGQSWNSIWRNQPDKLYNVWAESPDQFVTFFGRSTYHYKNNQWQETTAPTNGVITALWGFSTDNLIATGSYGEVFRYDGIAWTLEPDSLKGTFRHIHGTSEVDIHAVGYQTIYHFNGSFWEKMFEDDNAYIEAVWAINPNSAFAVGENGLILQYDGSGWARMASGVTGRLTDVWGVAGDDVYAVGREGLLQFDGKQWSKRPVYQGRSLQRIIGRAKDDIIALGYISRDNMFQLRFDGRSWHLEEGNIFYGELTMARNGRYIMFGTDYIGISKLYVNNR